MVKHYIYNVDKETVLEKISQLQPLNYNQFRWWRRFDTKNKPLHKYSDLLRKIQNGDYDFSHYYWQVKYSELEINEIYNECYPDYTKFNEKSAIHNARRKRLWLDFEKDEAEKLKLIPRDFQLTFKMTKKEVKEEMDKFGDSLEKFYIHCENKFGKRNKQMSTRGRPKKIK